MNSRLSVLCICLTVLSLSIAVSAKNVASPPAHTELRKVKVITNISDFVRSHPGVRVLNLRKEAGKARNQSVRYTLGARVSGDRLVAQSADVYAYPAKKDVSIQLTYPESGNGSVVTYVEIVCEQDSNDGNAYIIAGGIGQHYISIVVEATQTDNFSYTAQFYGTD